MSVLVFTVEKALCTGIRTRFVTSVFLAITVVVIDALKWNFFATFETFELLVVFVRVLFQISESDAPEKRRKSDYNSSEVLLQTLTLEYLVVMINCRDVAFVRAIVVMFPH